MESRLLPISQSKTQECSGSDALIREWLFRFGVNFEKDVAPVLPLWLETFGGMKPEILEPLFKKALTACKFFPRVADILEQVEHAKGNAAEEEAAQKWTKVLEYIQLHWNPDIPPKNAPRITERTLRAINAAGGLAYLADCDLEQKQWARKRFIEQYIRYGELQQEQFLLPDGEVKNLLAGAAETKSVGRLLETPKERPPVPKPQTRADTVNAMPIRETPRVIDVEGRLRGLKAQAELIEKKYGAGEKEMVST